MHVRVAGILLKGSTLLMVKHNKCGRDYWLLPGGRIATGEYSARALKREFLEELQLEVDVGELLFVVETVFSVDKHIIQPTFLVEAKSLKYMGRGKDERVVDFGFFNHDDLRKLIIYPDIGEELREFILNGKVKNRYLLKKWID
ncbi:MAG: NUDIX domain-containing protein [Spirochaetota bacterium]